MTFATTKLSTAARARVRQRLQERPKLPIIDSVLGELDGTHSASIASLARDLSSLIGVDIEHLRLGETLRDELRVHRDELTSDVRGLLPKVGLRDVVDPFAFSLLDLVEKRFREDPSRLKRAAFFPLPASEDEWIDRILGMTISDFLKALS